MSSDTLGIIGAVLGLAMGLGGSYLFRRWRGAPLPRPVARPAPANRQQARKADRDEKKRTGRRS